VNLSGIRAGDVNAVQVKITSGGAPFDLTGRTVGAQARKKATDESAALTADVTVTDEPGGIVMLKWPGEDVRALVSGAGRWIGVWDLQVASGTDRVTVVEGAFEANMDVTR